MSSMAEQLLTCGWSSPGSAKLARSKFRSSVCLRKLACRGVHHFSSMLQEKLPGNKRRSNKFRVRHSLCAMKEHHLLPQGLLQAKFQCNLLGSCECQTGPARSMLLHIVHTTLACWNFPSPGLSSTCIVLWISEANWENALGYTDPLSESSALLKNLALRNSLKVERVCHGILHVAYSVVGYFLSYKIRLTWLN